MSDYSTADQGYPNQGFSHDPYNDGPERTSVLAILSLISSVICCIPGLGVLGVLLGVGAFIGIGTSRGRVGGRGLAIAGIIIGLIVSVVWVVSLGTVAYGFNTAANSVTSVMADIEAERYTAARTVLLPPASEVGDAGYAAFRDAYQAELGSYVGGPDGFFDYITRFADPSIGPQVQQNQGSNEMFPLPADFDNGMALVIFNFDQYAQPGANATMPIADISIHLPSGTVITLSDYAGEGPPPPPAGANGANNTGGDQGDDSDDDSGDDGDG